MIALCVQRETGLTRSIPVVASMYSYVVGTSLPSRGCKASGTFVTKSTCSARTYVATVMTGSTQGFSMHVWCLVLLKHKRNSVINVSYHPSVESLTLS